MAFARGKHLWLLLMLLGFTLLAWRWLWGSCWNPLDTACFEGVEGGDYQQHFYGWLAYAEGNPESIVPPMFSNWTWPTVVPLLYTDPIPIAAIIFRPVYQLINMKFQYFSSLSLINMLISSLCGYLLGCRVVGSRLSGCILGILLALAPPAVWRLYAHHEALSLHALLVIPITLLILRNSTLWIWALVLFVATGVHAYYLPLLFPFIIVRTISAEMKPTRFFYNRAIKLLPQHSTQAVIVANSVARLADAGCILSVCLLGLFLFGYTAGGMSPTAEGVLWNANLHTFFDSQGHSSIFAPLKKIEPFQVEGFAYLGIIITLLATISLYLLLQRRNQPRGILAPTVFPSPRTYWALIFIALLYSFGLNLYFGDQQIVSLQSLADSMRLDTIYSTFRATGRFTWPAYYSILVWGFCTVARSVRNTKALALVVLVLLFETHIFTLAQARASFTQRHDSGVNWRQLAKKSQLDDGFAAIISNSDVFYNATGDPWFKTKMIPPLYISAVNSTIHSNYSPYLSRKPLLFNQKNSGDSCELAVNAVRLASEQGLKNPLLLLKDQAARTCKQLEFTLRFPLDNGISAYSAKAPSTPRAD